MKTFTYQVNEEVISACKSDEYFEKEMNNELGYKDAVYAYYYAIIQEAKKYSYDGTNINHDAIERLVRIDAPDFDINKDGFMQNIDFHTARLTANNMFLSSIK